MLCQAYLWVLFPKPRNSTTCILFEVSSYSESIGYMYNSIFCVQIIHVIISSPNFSIPQTKRYRKSTSFRLPLSSRIYHESSGQGRNSIHRLSCADDTVCTECYAGEYNNNILIGLCSNIMHQLQQVVDMTFGTHTILAEGQF